MKYLPEWFPGFKSGAIARECRPALQRLYDFPLQAVRAQMVSNRQALVTVPGPFSDINGIGKRNSQTIVLTEPPGTHGGDGATELRRH